MNNHLKGFWRLGILSFVGVSNGAGLFLLISDVNLVGVRFE